MNVSALNDYTFLVKSAIENYNYFLYELEDPRVKKWLIISSPLPTLWALSIYLLLIYTILPRFMKKRKPFDLRRVICCYNLFQILACATLVFKLITPLSEPSYVWKCERFQYSQDAISLRRLSLSYYFYWIKMLDLVETVFFVLRKKIQQVSVLHVYHHIITLSFAWFYVKYFTGGMVSFCMTLNTTIHVIMYTYYLFASFGSEWQKRVQKWKPVLTTLQMVQLSVLIVHSSQVLFNKNCGLPNFTFYLYAPNVAVILYMFNKFYQKTYSRRLKKVN